MHIWLDLKCEEQAKDDEMKKCKSFHDIQCLLVKTQFFIVQSNTFFLVFQTEELALDKLFNFVRVLNPLAGLLKCFTNKRKMNFFIKTNLLWFPSLNVKKLSSSKKGLLSYVSTE